ncbi:hypothetical protein DL764_005585 [Monosporascus ibericus]|uniref:Sister chromatid cohesion protein Ctf8 n=1 Tax=Monosporascus ibericus TaxID=155417 RepID=A0A4Q4TAF3_9PEZI|nr:hypothetical protein DL764_005585 [Monosporascus ibericus]
MAPTVKLHPQRTSGEGIADNPLPQLIRTPSGLAILELQGTINLPEADPESEGKSEEIPIGRITFPDYNPEFQDPSSTSWMKQVHLYVGQHQRLTGEVKKLPRALAVIRKRASDGQDVNMAGSTSDTTIDELEVVEIVKYKLVFSHRPEPVGTG